MAPVGTFQRPDGEHAIVHRCLGCGFERFNRIAADDNFARVLDLPRSAPRTSREIKARRWQEWLVEETIANPAPGAVTLD